MNKNILITALGLTLVLSSCSGKKDTVNEKEVKNTPKVVKMENMAVEFYYVCPMESHKHITSDKAGPCESCGMQLVQAVPVNPEDAEFYACPRAEHSHLRSDKPGECTECGSGLHAMKLKTI